MRNLRWRTAILVLAPFAACALIYLPTLSGALLSDDYAVLAALSDWSQQRQLLLALVSKFYSGLDSPSLDYRPLSMASFGFILAGRRDPFVWRLTNLACIWRAARWCLPSLEVFRSSPLAQVWSVVASGQANGTALPTDYFCWSENSSRIVRLSLPPGAAQGDWLSA
jgi:hypothetical protein